MKRLKFFIVSASISLLSVDNNIYFLKVENRMYKIVKL
jgi:hypothetical protein